MIAAPIVALAALGAADLLLGGNAHLTRSVLQAGGFDQLADVAERRLRLSAGNFTRYADTPALWIAALAIITGIAQRRRIEAWFADRRTAWAGLGGASAATVAAALANDSGALMLIVGTAFCALAAGLAWATHRGAAGTAPRGRLPQAGTRSLTWNGAGIVLQAGSSLPSRPASSELPASLTVFAIAGT